MNYKIGNGIDIHKIIKKNTKQKLGGLTFDLDYKIVAHSDGDIILHSISSAILGAMSLEDLGTYFPDNKKETKDLDSIEILNMCLNFLRKENYQISNIDITIICEYIIFKEIKREIKNNLEKLLDTNISLKATRYEEEKSMIEVHTTLLISNNKIN